VSGLAFVADASMAAAWLLPDEASAAAERLLAGVEAIHVPSLFWFEIRNLLAMAERRGRIKVGDALPYLLRLRELPFQDDGSGADVASLALMQRHSLTAYDAAYLALAKAEAVPLATLDRKLALASRTEDVALLGPLAESAGGEP
jgi:predicted nucleic acid-binding protein